LVLTLVGLFVWSFAAATVFPLASELPFAVVVSHSNAWLVPVLVATAGNTLGACTSYGLGRAAVTIVPPSSPGTLRAADLLRRYGPPALLLSWVPLVGDVIVVLAGAARMPFVTFAGWTTVGKAARYAALAAAVLWV
jgi:membrane protein YqaA with SNARE-associated domain